MSGRTRSAKNLNELADFDPDRARGHRLAGRQPRAVRIRRTFQGEMANRSASRATPTPRNQSFWIVASRRTACSFVNAGGRNGFRDGSLEMAVLFTGRGRRLPRCRRACGFDVRAGGFAPSVTGNRSELEWIGAGCHVSVSPTRIRGLLEFGV